MKPALPRLIGACLTVVALLGAPPRASVAQTPAKDSYPDRTIRLIVGFAAGGGNDIIARIIGQ